MEIRKNIRLKNEYDQVLHLPKDSLTSLARRNAELNSVDETEESLASTDPSREQYVAGEPSATYRAGSGAAGATLTTLNEDNDQEDYVFVHLDFFAWIFKNRV